MRKKKAVTNVTKSAFLRQVLSQNEELEFGEINHLWHMAGHADSISNALYYQVRSKLGIKSGRTWVPISVIEAEAARRRGTVYQFKITLLESQPPIWRRIQAQDCTLDKLHEHIQTAMGWTNSHLHHFQIDGQLYGDPLLMQENFEEMQYEDSTTTELSALLPRSGKRFKFLYEYDFGDSWEHEVLFEGCLKPQSDLLYPLCVEGERACPPEDCGGVWGYADFLTAISDPDHEDHDGLLEWAGGSFDPEAFDPVKATLDMKAGLPDWRQDRF
jgi:hypothetical protein